MVGPESESPYQTDPGSKKRNIYNSNRPTTTQPGYGSRLKDKIESARSRAHQFNQKNQVKSLEEKTPSKSGFDEEAHLQNDDLNQSIDIVHKPSKKFRGNNMSPDRVSYESMDRGKNNSTEYPAVTSSNLHNSSKFTQHNQRERIDSGSAQTNEFDH